MIFKNYEIVLFSGDFVQFITPVVTVLAVFLTYFLAKTEFKFKNYYERKIDALCELYGMLEELKFLLTYEDFNQHVQKITIFLDISSDSPEISSQPPQPPTPRLMQSFYYHKNEIFIRTVTQ